MCVKDNLKIWTVYYQVQVNGADDDECCKAETDAGPSPHRRQGLYDYTEQCILFILWEQMVAGYLSERPLVQTNDPNPNSVNLTLVEMLGC